MPLTNQNFPQDSLSFMFKLPGIGQAVCNNTLNVYEQQQILQQQGEVDQYSQWKYYAILLGALIKQSPQKTFSKKIKTRTKIFQWQQDKGINIFVSYDRNYRPDKITNRQHFQLILNFLKQKDLPYIGKIYKVSPSTKKKKVLLIEQQKGLSIKPKGNDYLKYNIFFHTMQKKDQIKFLRESIKPIIQLNKHKIDHNDVTFRNYIYSLLNNCFKLIDFDVSIMYNQKSQKNVQLCVYESQTQLSSLRMSFKSSQSQKAQSLIYSNQQIKYITSGNNNYQKLREENIGKKDTIMYGFMILRLLYHIQKDQYENITEEIGKLVKMYQEGQLSQVHKFNQILLKNFEHKYIKIVKFILQKMMVRSCRKRYNLFELQTEWIQLVNQIQKNASKLTQNNSNQNEALENISRGYSNSSYNSQKLIQIFGQTLESKLFIDKNQQSELKDIKDLELNKNQKQLRNTTEEQKHLKLKKIYEESQSLIQQKFQLQLEKQQKKQQQQSTTIDTSASIHQNCQPILIEQLNLKKSESVTKSQENDKVDELLGKPSQAYLNFCPNPQKKCSKDSIVKNRQSLKNGKFQFLSKRSK